jgi:hypothetical protein
MDGWMMDDEYIRMDGHLMDACMDDVWMDI